MSNDYKLLSQKLNSYQQLHLLFSEILEIDKIDDIYKFITVKLHEHYENTAILYVSIDEIKKETCLEAISGINEKFLNYIFKTLNVNPIGKKYKLLEEHHQYFKSGHLVEFKGGLSEFSRSEFLPFLAKTFEKLIGINKIYTIGITKGYQLLSAIHFFTYSNTVTIDSNFIELFVKMAGVVIQRKLAEFELKQEKEKESAIISAIPDMLFVLDKNGIYLDFHIPSHVIRCDPPRVFVGQSIKNVLPNDIYNGFIPIFQDVTNDKQVHYFNYSMEMPDKLRYFEARSISVDNERVLSLVRDVTDIHEKQQLIEKQNDELKQTIYNKNKLMSILSHDLSSPFNYLIGSTQLYIQNFSQYNDEKKIRMLQNINDISNQSYILLQDLLLWSKTESDSFKLNLTSISCIGVFKDLKSFYELLCNNKNLTIIIENTSDITIKADLDIIKTILRNLISNAIKFSYEKGVIGLSVSKLKNENKAHIIVTDQGVGIGPEEIKKIWDISTPHTTKGTNQEIGTGLGLLICKEFVEKHNGKIWIESEIGKGTKVHFTLPLDYH